MMDEETWERLKKQAQGNVKFLNLENRPQKPGDVAHCYLFAFMAGAEAAYLSMERRKG